MPGDWMDKNMALTVAIQMDPIEKIDIGGDSTFALALEAQTRGHGLLYYGPRDLSFNEGKVTARVRPLNPRCQARASSARRQRRCRASTPRRSCAERVCFPPSCGERA